MCFANYLGKRPICAYMHYIAPDGCTYTHSECGVRISELQLDTTDLDSQKTNTSKGSQMLSSADWPWTDISWEEVRTRHVIPLVREYIRQSAQYYSTSMPQILTLDVMLTEGQTPQAFFIECNTGGIIFSQDCSRGTKKRVIQDILSIAFNSDVGGFIPLGLVLSV